MTRLPTVFLLVLSTCANAPGAPGAASNGGVKSLYTDLNLRSCAKDVDKSDPNETPYWVCAGVAGYRLQIRQVEAGRLSINVVNPAKKEFPLNYQDVVTRSMSSLDDKAEWRVIRKNGKMIPLALIVRVMAREKQDEPEKITNTYLTVAKIAVDGACVTDSIRQGSKPVAQVRALADSTAARPCASQLPPASEVH